jgi:hypothetical protein
MKNRWSWTKALAQILQGAARDGFRSLEELLAAQELIVKSEVPSPPPLLLSCLDSQRSSISLVGRRRARPPRMRARTRARTHTHTHTHTLLRK